MSTTERWLANHAVTELWSGWDDKAIAWTMVPQWSVFQQLENQQGTRIHVHYFGNSTSEAGDVWVDAQDVGPIDRPARTVEPEWPHPSPPPEETVHVNPDYHPPTAPEIPADHLPYLAAAARSAQIDVGILAATAARESSFGNRAYREEPELAFVRWRSAPEDSFARFPDGSLGPCQILRSNFLAFAVDNDEEAYSPEHNYRVASLIIRSNFAAFPTDRWKAVAAYNVGQYGAKVGRIPAGGYVDTILRWAEEYAKLFANDVGSVNGSGSSAGATRPPTSPASGAGTSAASSGASATSGIGQNLIQYGMTLLGTPYVFGGKFIARDHGIDCSGFVCEIFEHCGIRLGDREYLSADAIRQMTRPVTEAEAITGDLIFFQNTYDTPGASHIGIWIGQGKMLDCHTHGGAQITNIDQPYWQEHFLALGQLPQLDHQPLPPPAPTVSPPAPPPEIVPRAPEATSCSFCGRAGSEVSRLIGGTTDPKVAICNLCVKLYDDLIGQTLPGGWAGRYE